MDDETKNRRGGFIRFTHPDCFSVGNVSTVLVRPARFSLILLLCLWSISLQGCAESHILLHREGLSRTWIYIDFSRNKDPYETISNVGGEHMTFYKILGFEGDEFHVTIETLEGNVFWGVEGDGVLIESLPGGDTEKRSVTVVASEAIFTIDFSAHPFGGYKLKVEKLPSAP